MDRYITKSKYFSQDFNTAIFADPLRIYFSSEHESQALELYFKMQPRKEKWEKFLRDRGTNNYCYILLYKEEEQFVTCFESQDKEFAPGEMGEDFILGIRGPLSPSSVDTFLDELDQKIGYTSAPREVLASL